MRGLAAIGTPEATAVLQQVYTRGELELREAAREVTAELKAKAT